MTAIITISELTTKFGEAELTRVAVLSGEALADADVQSRIQNAVDAIDGEIKATISSRIDPDGVSTWPQVVKQMAGVLILYSLQFDCRRETISDLDTQTVERVRKWFQDYADGKKSLSLSEETGGESTARDALVLVTGLGVDDTENGDRYAGWYS